MGVGSGLYMYDVVVKRSRSLYHLLMSSCFSCYGDWEVNVLCASLAWFLLLLPITCDYQNSQQVPRSFAKLVT